MEQIRENMAKAAEFRALQTQTDTEENEHHISETEELVKLQEKGEHEEQIRIEPKVRDHDDKLSEDVKRHTLMERANAEREKWFSAISSAFKHIGGGIKTVLADQNKMVVAVGGMTAFMAAGIYTARCSRH